MNLKRIEKEKLSERFNISIATFYNWEKSKPELMKIIELGLQKEKELEKMEEIGIKEPNNVIMEMMEEIKNIKEEIKELKK